MSYREDARYFPRAFSQVATSKMWNFTSSNFSSLFQRQQFVPNLVYPQCSAPYPHHICSGWPPVKLPLHMLHIWEVDNWRKKCKKPSQITVLNFISDHYLLYCHQYRMRHQRRLHGIYVGTFLLFPKPCNLFYLPNLLISQ